MDDDNTPRSGGAAMGPLNIDAFICPPGKIIPGPCQPGDPPNPIGPIPIGPIPI